MEKHIVFWFRRDLRLEDNHGLFEALNSGKKVIPIFIFDPQILSSLPKFDKRVLFIYRTLEKLQGSLAKFLSGIRVFYGEVLSVFEQLIENHSIHAVYTNEDYEPYAISRDNMVRKLLSKHGISFHSFKDSVIFHKNEILKEDGSPYTVYTPYSKKWKSVFQLTPKITYPSEKKLEFLEKIGSVQMPTLEGMGFIDAKVKFPESKISEEIIKNYAEKRDFPAEEHGTTRMSLALRFGTVSIRELYYSTYEISQKYANELIWREFYKMILYHFPHVVYEPFHKGVREVDWINDETHFQRWCNGETGYPIVDAGMRELNETGYMHNRVRMITTSFLVKNLLIDWRWGEQYFAEKLLDFDLSSNNGSWQWVAGCGCDAAPYFRVFNPYLQTEKFDPEKKYIRKWVPEFESFSYPKPIVDQKMSSQRAVEVLKKAYQKL